MKLLPLPSAERLRELFNYDPKTGSFIRAIDCVWVKKGSVLSCSNAFGHVPVQVDGGKYLVHRIIWKMVTGHDPGQIDHRDGNPANNTWSNLREATRGQNNANAKIRKDNTSGVKGVWFALHAGRWRGMVTFDGANHYVGYFDSLEDAAAAVAEARVRLHGEFARAA